MRRDPYSAFYDTKHELDCEIDRVRRLGARDSEQRLLDDYITDCTFDFLDSPTAGDDEEE